MRKAAEVFRIIVGEIRFCYLLASNLDFTKPYVLQFLHMILTCYNFLQIHSSVVLGFSKTALNNETIKS